MRLLSCHIENFGKLHDWSYEFQDGCNIICEENGWGKSTFVAFIRVMLYGFANETKRNDLENERKRFKPWQGGVYGGSLTFETEGRSYVCHRVFGEKEKDDRFELRDAETFLETHDFSNRLGEELFQIDADSFCRSVCIGQLSSDIQYVKTTGSMNAKLGNLVEDTEDINNFEKVDKKLTDLLNAMSPQRRTGSIHRQKEELEELRCQLRQRPELGRAIEGLKAKRQEEIGRKEILAAQRGEVSEKQRRLVLLEKRKHIGSMLEIYRLSAEEQRQLDAYGRQFAAGVPSPEELERMKTRVQVWRENNRSLSEYRLSAKDEERLSEYEQRFGSAPPSEEEVEEQISNWELRTRKKGAFSAKEASLNLAEMMMRQTLDAAQKAKTGRNMRVLCFILAGIFGGAGIFLLLFQSLFGIAGLLLGVLLASAGVAIGHGKARKTEQNPVRTEQTVFELEEELKEDALFIEEMENELENYLARYGIVWDESEVLNNLHQLKNDAQEYQRLLKQEETLRERRREYRNDERQQIIAGFLNAYYAPETVRTGEYGELLQRLAGECAEYQRILEKKKCYEEQVKACEEQEAGLPAEDGTAPEESADELFERQKWLSEQAELIQNNIHTYDMQLEDYAERIETITGQETELEEKKEAYEIEVRRYRNLTATQKYLRQAKENLTEKYMKPLKSSFEKYYRMLTGEDVSCFRLDANANLTVEEQGLPRKPEFLSTGYRDLLGLCMRMALVDAMYQDSQPFILLDDPFVNYDDRKREGGMEFLKSAAEKNQIIYVTCRT